MIDCCFQRDGIAEVSRAKPITREEQPVIPTPTVGKPLADDEPSTTGQAITVGSFNELYQELHPGVVNIQVLVVPGEGAGSGFVYNDQLIS